MSAPEVSVIIPAYNAGRYLERAVASALAQDGVDGIEVVIVDDASSDDTRTVMDRLAAADPRIVTRRNPVNSGAAVSRNVACAAATGRWIAVLDADDAYLPGRLRRLIDTAEASGLDIVADLPVMFDLEAGRAAPHQPEASGRLEILTLKSFLGDVDAGGERIATGMLKPVLRRALVDQGLWRYREEARHGQDFIVCFECLRAGARYGVLHEAHYLFSTRIGAVTGRYSPGSVTPVNYLAIRRDTLALMDELDPEADSEVRALLGRRVEACEAQNIQYGWLTLRKGAFARHWRWLRQDPGNPGRLLREVLRRGGRRIRRSGSGA